MPGLCIFEKPLQDMVMKNEHRHCCQLYRTIEMALDFVLLPTIVFSRF